MPENDKILKDIEALISLWLREMIEAEIVRNSAVEKLRSLRDELIIEDLEDLERRDIIRRFDISAMYAEAAMRDLKDDRDRLKTGTYYAEILRNTIKDLAGKEDAPKDPEELQETISLSETIQKTFAKIYDICKPSIIDRKRPLKERIKNCKGMKL